MQNGSTTIFQRSGVDLALSAMSASDNRHAGAAAHQDAARRGAPARVAALANLPDASPDAFATGRPEARPRGAGAGIVVHHPERQRAKATVGGQGCGPEPARLAPWQARRAIALIEASVRSGGTVEIAALAAEAGLATVRFSRAFRAAFGLSPQAYAIRRRIRHAQEMMLVTNRSAGFIAIACGFADQSHLARWFRRIVGVTPARWRRLRRPTVE
jgi:AraC-like DNA-binding protein